MARIVDAILIDDQCSNEPVELQERMPIPAVARQPRGLTRDHSANLPFANGGEQLLETGTRGAATRATEFVVDYGHLAPAQLPGKVGQAVLAALALAVVDDLVCRRLVNVDDGPASKVLRRDIAHRRPPGFTSCASTALSVSASLRISFNSSSICCWASIGMLLYVGWLSSRSP